LKIYHSFIGPTRTTTECVTQVLELTPKRTLIIQVELFWNETQYDAEGHQRF